MFGFKSFWEGRGLTNPIDDEGGSFQNLGDDGETYWAGSGGGASGVLPICTRTGKICFAWRSFRVHQGDCYGTIGGAIRRGLTPEQNARQELSEETGYRGSIQLYPAFVFRSGRFSYYNFLGAVNSEFPFRPLKGHSWETDEIRWFTYEEALQEVEHGNCHPGLVALFRSSGEDIRRLARQQGGGFGKENNFS